VNFLKRIIPIGFKKAIIRLIKPFNKVYLKNEITKAAKNHEIAVKKLKGTNNKLKVVFFLINVDAWKLDSVYHEFKKQENYDPLVVICPFINKGEEFLLKELQKGIDYSIVKNYKYLVGYDRSKMVAVDVKKKIDPDIVFFTNPNDLSSKEFLIGNYSDKLTCYIPYSFRIDKLYKYSYDSRLVNLVWLNFFETNIHKSLARIYATNKGENVVVSGFPFLDSYRDDLKYDKIWKKGSEERKKIIWAPHWTIKNAQDTGLDWSCFLDYSEFILRIAVKYKDKIQLAIKPHPFLKITLSQEKLWGIEKTETYFKKWEELENCQIVDGDYKGLFMESDALIHDSGSFMAEYLALNKPMGYTANTKLLKNRFNEFGVKALSCHSLIGSENDLENFINNVIENVDLLGSKRKSVILEQKINIGKTSAEKIVNYIENKLR
tara:strand:- start:19837 stop:21138 length:1302 start_codon:yes stop_codon:yes gene_type:complete